MPAKVRVTIRPLAKDIDDFVFEGSPINETLVRDLASGNFLEHQRNCVLVGGTGTGKTHLSIAIARSCIRDGARGRFFNVVGPRQTGAYGMVLPRFIAAASAGKPLLVHDDGQQVRCFAHVRDVVSAVLDLMQTPEAVGQVFNIGSEWIKQPEDVVPTALFLASQPDLGPTAQSFSLMRRDG